MDGTPKDPGDIRVVDRRWWARGEGEESADDASARKPTYVEDLERQLSERAEQLQALMVEHRRSLEEFEQAKLRIRRDTSKEVERGKRAVLVEVLEVLDNLDRALSSAHEKASADAPSGSLTRGVELVRDHFVTVLSGLGVKRDDSLNQEFDASRHQAVGTIPVTDPAKNGRILSVLKEGYIMGEDVLRPASVMVGRAGD